MSVRYSVVIATWNARDALAACLDSVAAQDLDGRLETIVVDNASSDGTAELLAARDDVVAIPSAVNDGYCAGINRGAGEASGEVLFLLNSDTVLRPRALQRLADALRLSGVGLAAPRYEWPDGSHQPGCAAFPSVPRALLLGSGLHRLLPDRTRARLAPTHWSHDRSREVDFVMGAVLAIEANLFRELGGLWPLMYGSEQDLAWRVRKRGLATRYVDDALVMHVGGYSNRRRYPDTGRAARVGRAELAFLAEHYGRGRAQAIRAISGVAFAVRALALGLAGSPRAGVYRALARTYAAGLPDGAPRRYGP